MTILTAGHTASTPEQARLLLDEACHPLLSVLIGRETGAAELARETGQDVKRVHARLGRLERAGLVICVGERPRAGRPVRLYRAAARSFYVPFALTEAGTLAELVERASAPYQHAIFAAIERIYRDEAALELLVAPGVDGQLSVNLGPLGERRGMTDVYGAFATFGELLLSPATRQAAEVKLRELSVWLWERSAAERDGPDAAPCLVALSLVPGGRERA